MKKKRVKLRIIKKEKKSEKEIQDDDLEKEKNENSGEKLEDKLKRWIFFR